MSPRRVILAFAASVASAAVPLAQKSGAELLDEVLNEPGGYAQMCSFPPATPLDVPLPLYSTGPRGEHFISKSNFDRLRAQRATVVEAITGRLQRLDLGKPADARLLSTDLLRVVLELQAVEVLPGLLRIEDDLHARLGKATPVDTSTLPKLSGGSMVFEWGPGMDEESVTKLGNLIGARLFHRQLLSVTAALLRREWFAPILTTTMEQRYREVLKKRAEGTQLSMIKQAADIPLAQRTWISFDPIYNLPVELTNWVEYIPYTEELRTEIRQVAQDYLKQRAAEKKAK